MDHKKEALASYKTASMWQQVKSYIYVSTFLLSNSGEESFSSHCNVHDKQLKISTRLYHGNTNYCEIMKWQAFHSMLQPLLVLGQYHWILIDKHIHYQSQALRKQAILLKTNQIVYLVNVNHAWSGFWTKLIQTTNWAWGEKDAQWGNTLLSVRDQCKEHTEPEVLSVFFTQLITYYIRINSARLVWEIYFTLFQ